MEIVPIALEIGMRLHRQHYVQVAGISAITARVALSLVANPCAVLDTGRNLHLDDVLFFNPRFTVAGVAWLGDHLTRSAADGAGTRNREEALLEAHLAASSALLTDACRFSVRRTRAAAFPADVHALNADGRLLAKDRFFEVQRQVIANVAAALCTGRAPTACAGDVEHLSEKVAKDIAQVHTAGKAPGTGSTTHSGMTIAVVCRALVGIAQHLVSLACLLEA